MGQVLDIVPNHMCITGGGNRYWTDLLENGPASLCAAFFDIDWDPVKKELRNKVLLPFSQVSTAMCWKTGKYGLSSRMVLSSSVFMTTGCRYCPTCPGTS